MAYTFRHPDEGDIWRAYEVMRAVSLADEGEFDLTEDDMQVIWRTNRRENGWIAEALDGSAAGLAAIHVRHATRLRTFAGVVPEHRGKGVGTRLVELLEKRARELAAEASPGEPVMLGQVVGPRCTDAAPLLERHGYEFVRIFWKMGIDLDKEPAEPEVPEGLTLESMRPGSERRMFDASEEAFRDHWDHHPHDYDEWLEWTVRRETFDPKVWLVAYDGDEIAGLSMNYLEPEVAWVGVLAVRRPWRNRGLGLALLHASFREFWKRGIPRALLGVDADNPTGATRLYERAGMHVVSEERMYWKDVRAA